MKILFQEICLGRYGWDALLPPHLEQLWRKWLTDLEKVRVIIVPCCIYHGISEQIVSYSLHTYGDASLKAYCAAIYIVIQTAISSYVHLLSSKTSQCTFKEADNSTVGIVVGTDYSRQLKRHLSLQSRLELRIFGWMVLRPFTGLKAKAK